MCPLQQSSGWNAGAGASYMSGWNFGAGKQGILQDYPWHRYTRFVDIGGAYGSFLMALLEQTPRATGVLFDQPQVVAAVERELPLSCWSACSQLNVLNCQSRAPAGSPTRSRGSCKFEGNGLGTSYLLRRRLSQVW